MSDCFRFGGFELDFAAYALRRYAERIKLEKIPMEVLILLVGRAGQLVERRDIQAALWATDIFVERDSAINTAIRKVRQALGDDAEKPRYVETVVGKGYRFIAPVEHRRPASHAGKSHLAGPRPSSARWRRPFPSYSVTRGKQEFALATGDNLLGRDPTSRVYVDHASVSRRHARISIGPDQAILEDLNSRNGTFLDGRRIETPTKLRSGAIIGLGAITLTFLVLSGPASTQPLSTAASKGLGAGEPES